MNIYLMPHSKESEPDFQTIDDFIDYLENELPGEEEYVYRNNQQRLPGKFIMVFDGLIVGEIVVTERIDNIPSDNNPYKCDYPVEKGSIKIYDKRVPFADFREKTALSAISVNFAPGIDEKQYRVLLDMIMK